MSSESSIVSSESSSEDEQHYSAKNKANFKDGMTDCGPICKKQCAGQDEYTPIAYVIPTTLININGIQYVQYTEVQEMQHKFAEYVKNDKALIESYEALISQHIKLQEAFNIINGAVNYANSSLLN